MPRAAPPSLARTLGRAAAYLGILGALGLFGALPAAADPPATTAEGATKPAVVEKYNDLARAEIEHIRDFVCMHYHLTNREDTPFWRYCKNMAVPDSLRQRMDLFRQDAHVYFNHGELFNIDSWVAVMMGQGIMPQGYHPFARVNDLELQRFLSSYRAQVAQMAEGLPSHADFVRQYCGASEMAWTS